MKYMGGKPKAIQIIWILALGFSRNIGDGSRINTLLICNSALVLFRLLNNRIKHHILSFRLPHHIKMALSLVGKSRTQQTTKSVC